MPYVIDDYAAESNPAISNPGEATRFRERPKKPLAVEGYRSGILSVGEIAEMLGLSINDADGFLKERGLMAIVSIDEIDHDSETLEGLPAK